MNTLEWSLNMEGSITYRQYHQLPYLIVIVLQCFHLFFVVLTYVIIYIDNIHRYIYVYPYRKLFLPAAPVGLFQLPPAPALGVDEAHALRQAHETAGEDGAHPQHHHELDAERHRRGDELGRLFRQAGAAGGVEHEGEERAHGEPQVAGEEHPGLDLRVVVLEAMKTAHVRKDFGSKTIEDLCFSMVCVRKKAEKGMV